MRLQDEFYQCVRLALTGEIEDIRLFVARLVRKYRKEDPDFALQLETLLKAAPTRSNPILRKGSAQDFDFNEKYFEKSEVGSPVDQDTHLSILSKIDTRNFKNVPLLEGRSLEDIKQLIEEKKNYQILEKHQLRAAKSAIFTGQPGVGKTITAVMIAKEINLPLYKLDIASVMSSFLGKSGINLKSAFEFAKKNPCVLFLDEIDSIAKSRSDSSDIGELKRLVTVILQEIDNWPNQSLLLAATNHEELIDKAIWRRFDMVIEFNKPSAEMIQAAIELFAEDALQDIIKYVPLLSSVFKDQSYSFIENEIYKLRKFMVLNKGKTQEYIQRLIRRLIQSDDKNHLKQIAVKAVTEGEMSVNAVATITGLHRNTINNALTN